MDRSLLTVYHAQTPRRGFHFTTYTLERSAADGDVTPETEGFEIAVLPVEEVLASSDRLRQSDREASRWLRPGVIAHFELHLPIRRLV